MEVVRHPRGADSKMREWIEQKAYYEKKFNNIYADEAEQQLIEITGPVLTIG